jgi:RNA-directed DNA polymerase
MDSLETLAGQLGLTSSQLTKWSHVAGLPSSYSTFQISKRSGGHRTIQAPIPPLRSIQRRLARLLAELYRPRYCVQGFREHRSVVSNAEEHARHRYVLNVDLKDFFPSIHLGRVRGALIGKPFGLNASVATTIALACHENHLPQGAPTSPILSNVVCMRLDGELSRLAIGLRCSYTRYADDITFSTSRTPFPTELAVITNPPCGTHATVGPALLSVITANDFSINEGKVRLCSRDHSQRVTGLTVNRFPNVQRTFVRQLRAMVHAWQKFGLASAQSEYVAKYHQRHRAPGSPEPKFARVVHGKLMYLAMVRGFSDPIYIKLARQCRSLDPGLFAAVLDRDDALERSVWVLECEETSIQGTGFFLEGYGLITCAHVLGPETQAFHASNPYQKYPVTVIASDPHVDLAVLSINAEVQAKLKLGNPDTVRHHSRILLAGHPAYGIGDALYKHWGTVTNRIVRHGLKLFVPSTPIAHGNSGGPVLDERFKVVGVAVRGVEELSDSGEAPPTAYGVLSIEHLKQLPSGDEKS